MPELLLELGVEELPASMVERAAMQLLDNVARGLDEARLGGGDGTWLATPRRLIISFPDVLDRQPDEDVERRGPSESSAFSDGKPTKALEGFARSLGITPSDVEVRDDYVWARFTQRGKIASEALSEILPDAIRGIAFDKTMRWGAGRMRFSRPIRWILALIGNQVAPFSVEGVAAGRSSFGHRFLSPEPFEFSGGLAGLLAGLRERFVEPDPERRRERIRSGAKELRARVLISESLLEENVYLVEWPRVIPGTFREEFLSLPRVVLVTAMAKHERFFPVEGEGGELTNEFISVINSGDEDVVRSGNEWVLNARFNDAKFFFDEDSRSSMDEFLEKTNRIVFQDKLGTIRMRADRISQLAPLVAQHLTTNNQNAKITGLYCKADLSTGLVSELPSLQGKIGGEYARRDGLPPEVCDAIAQHYDPEDSQLAWIVMCADQADRLAGYLGIGERPSGSSDPYALRKSAAMLVEGQLELKPQVGIVEWMRAAWQLYRKQGTDVADDLDGLHEIIYTRYETLDTPHDALAAAWEVGKDEPSHLFIARARTIAHLSEDVDFVRTAKRPANIVSAARKKGITFEGELQTGGLAESEEKALLAAYESIAQALNGDFSQIATTLRALKPPIDAFFDEVMVMVEDEKLRDNRLRLLAKIDSLFRTIGDFSKIVIEGE